jgi:Uma2 family endonuclease
MKPARIPYFSADDYLAFEETQASKHEYFQGEVFAMVGARDAHVTCSLNLASRLHLHLRGTPCRPYMADMKLRVEAADAFFYPDVFVTCDARDQANPLYKAHPRLIVEVLSDSTARFDRGEKFGAYRRLDALREYVLIDPDTSTVEVFRRHQGSDDWSFHAYGGTDTLHLASVELDIHLDELFENTQPNQTI